LINDDHYAKTGVVAQHSLVALGRFFQLHGFDRGLNPVENAEGKSLLLLDGEPVNVPSIPREPNRR
jgi:hypothetical protein